MVLGFPEQRLGDLLGNDAASEDPREGVVHHPLETAFEAIDTAHSIFLSSARRVTGVSDGIRGRPASGDTRPGGAVTVRPRAPDRRVTIG
jgi:hypothetical protein